MLRILLVWLSIIPFAILNGGLRQEILIPLLGEKTAQPISGILLCGIIFIIAYLFLKVKYYSYKKCYFIGLIWMILTIGFETVFCLLQGDTLQKIINNYDITTGNLWIIIVIFTGFVPVLIRKRNE